MGPTKDQIQYCILTSLGPILTWKSISKHFSRYLVSRISKYKLFRRSSCGVDVENRSGRRVLNCGVGCICSGSF